MTTAVVFPGQGSQSVGMLAELAAEHAVVETTFQAASSVVGVDLWSLTQQGTAEQLADTRVTQPLVFTANIALWRVLRQQGMPLPAVIAGHSLGEFSALVAANAISFDDGMALVKQRAEFMADAVPEGEGGMAALIGMEDDAVDSLCKELSGERIVEAVNFNAPGQVAISGHLDALELALSAAVERGARRALMLPVSVPNHSSLMQKAGARLCDVIDSIQWQMPEIPLIQNATAAPAADLDTLLARLRAHVFSPVYWTSTIATMRDNYAVDKVIECGPGKVLTGLGKRIDRQLPTLSTDNPANLQAALDAIGPRQEVAP